MVIFKAGLGVSECNSATIAPSNNYIPVGRWFHFGYTYDGTDVRIYVDGVLMQTTTFSSGKVGRPDHVMMGGRNSTFLEKNYGFVVLSLLRSPAFLILCSCLVPRSL
jgi:hypothetical protein